MKIKLQGETYDGKVKDLVPLIKKEWKKLTNKQKFGFFLVLITSIEFIIWIPIFLGYIDYLKYPTGDLKATLVWVCTLWGGFDLSFHEYMKFVDKVITTK